MQLHGIHHVTCITGDAPQNVDFYTGTLGLRMVKKTVNQDDPTVYHLFYADELGSAGADITFFEYPGAIAGRAGDGMVHRVLFRVGSEQSLDFWQERVGGERVDGGLRFADPEGLELELVIDDGEDPPLVARHPEIPEEHALRGFAGVRAYASNPEGSARMLEGLTLDACRRRLGVARRCVTARTSTTRRRPSAAFRAPAPCITSRGRCRSTSMRAGSRRRCGPVGARRP